jgi:hypothetical protein
MGRVVAFCNERLPRKLSTVLLNDKVISSLAVCKRVFAVFGNCIDRVGSEVLRPWMSDIHIGLGLCLPVLFFVHVLVGRRSSQDDR